MREGWGEEEKQGRVGLALIGAGLSAENGGKLVKRERGRKSRRWRVGGEGWERTNLGGEGETAGQTGVNNYFVT